MKLLLLATALVIGSNAAAISAEKTLNFKLVTIYIGQKDGENHLMGGDRLARRQHRDQGLLRQGR